MVWVVAFDEAKKNQIRREAHSSEGGVTKTPFIGSRKNPDLPHADLNQHDPGRFSSTHFHIRDQFQVVIDGKGTLGRHELAPYCVHFSRAYTPYGPLIADPGTGLTFFVMRAHPDNGSQHLPEEQDQLNRALDRRPWQMTRSVTLPICSSNVAIAETTLQAVPDIKDEKGLAVYTLSMKPNSKAYAPDPSYGDGQYVVVVKGSLLHNDKEHTALALAFIKPDEGQFQVHAGSQGLEALILNFPLPQVQTTSITKAERATSGFITWRCSVCSFVYSEAAGLPEEGIAAGTRWQDVPETWSCPDCNACKADFRMIEL